jgi:hypothetical protein
MDYWGGRGNSRSAAAAKPRDLERTGTSRAEVIISLRRFGGFGGGIHMRNVRQSWGSHGNKRSNAGNVSSLFLISSRFYFCPRVCWHPTASAHEGKGKEPAKRCRHDGDRAGGLYTHTHERRAHSPVHARITREGGGIDRSRAAGDAHHLPGGREAAAQGRPRRHRADERRRTGRGGLYVSTVQRRGSVDRERGEARVVVGNGMRWYGISISCVQTPACACVYIWKLNIDRDTLERASGTA